jgi:hypothetical protein
MIENNNNNYPNLKPRITVIAVIVILSWLILLPIVNQIRLPLNNPNIDLITFPTIANISPYTDYLKYLILFLVPALATAIVLNIKQVYIDKIINLFKKVINNNILLIIITSFILIAWLIRTYIFGGGFFNIMSPLIDPFHEGEYMAFLPNFLQQEKPFLNTFFIHGFGINVLPSLIANKLANGNGMILTKLFVGFLNILGVLAVFWVIWEIVNLFDLGKHKIKVFLSFVISFIAFDHIFLTFSGNRDALFMVQLALTIKWLNNSNIRNTQPPNNASNQYTNKKFNFNNIIAIIIGSSIPLSFLYVYDRSAYFILLYIVTSLLILIGNYKTNRQLVKDWLINTAIGLITATLFLILILGFDQLSAVLGQIKYWAKYGKYISFLPLPPFNLSLESSKYWWPMLLQSGVLVYLLFDYQKTRHISNFIKQNTILLILLLASCNYMRITIDRSDVPHALSGSLAAGLLLIYLLLTGYEKLWKISIDKFLQDSTHQILVTLLIIMLLFTNPAVNIGNTIKAIKTANLNTSDLQLLPPNYFQAVTNLEPEIDKQSCFFTLPSEGIWYYFYNKPSCSKFSYTFYALPGKAQAETIEDLEKTQPNIILFANTQSADKGDQVPLISQYILEKYRPYQNIANFWFWQRRQQPISFNLNNTNSQIKGTYSLSLPFNNNDQIDISKAGNLTINGWTVFPTENKPADAIFLTDGNNQIMAANLVNMPSPKIGRKLNNPIYNNSAWNMSVPIQSLKPGQHILKVWGYDSQADQLTQLGENIIINLFD